MEESTLDNGSLLDEGPASEEASPEFIHEKAQPSSVSEPTNENVNGDSDVIMRDDTESPRQDPLEKNDTNTLEDVNPNDIISPEGTGSEVTESKSPENENLENEEPENQTLEIEAPETETTSESKMLENKTQEGEVLESMTPENEIPKSETSENNVPEDKIQNNEIPDNETPENETPENETPENKTLEDEVPGNEAANETAENKPTETPISEIVKANKDQEESNQITEKETVDNKTIESVVDNAKNDLSPVENIVDNDDMEKDNVDDENVKDGNLDVQEENKTVGVCDENVENIDSMNKDGSPLPEQKQQTTNTNNIIQSGNLEPVSPGNEGLSPEREEDYQDDDDDGEVKDEELGPRYSPKAPVITIQPVNIVYFIRYPFFLLFSSFQLHERDRIRSAYWLERKKGICVA